MISTKSTHTKVNHGLILSTIRTQLLNWYDQHHRTLPWRVSPADSKIGVLPDPYQVWLSEIMLQQTTVAAVKSYFEKFMDRWPTILDLAACDEEDVLKAWAGLGYYSRARNLKKCADLIASDYDGKFPETEDELLKLPGIGAYTAAAIAAIAFNQKAAVVDGNIERVYTRLYAIKTPLPKAKPEIKAYVFDTLDRQRPGDFAQALMDLGASLCSPKKPSCLLCPISTFCAANKASEQELYPIKLPKKTKPKRVGAAFVIQDQSGAIFLRKRSSQGLLAGMTEVPTTDWNSNQDGATAAKAGPAALKWQKKGEVRHVFTHFELTLTVYHASVLERPQLDGWWSQPNEIASEALPNLMRKVVNLVIKP